MVQALLFQHPSLLCYRSPLLASKMECLQLQLGLPRAKTAALLVAEPMLLTFRMDVYSSTADALKVLFKVGRRLG